MPIYELTKDDEPLNPRGLDVTSFDDEKILEKDLQKMLRANIGMIVESPDVMVVAEEFSDWQNAARKIDLLGIDQDANLVVVELKKTGDGAHMELQALRYAAMVSTMTFEHAVEAYARFLKNEKRDAKGELLEFLGWEEPNEEEFAQKVRIVLASPDFGRELTTTVLWLRDQGVDIECARMRPYKQNKQNKQNNKILLDIQRIIPLPEAEQYQVRLRDKRLKERISSKKKTLHDVTLGGNALTNLPMVRAIHSTFKYLVEQGVSPEGFAECCPRPLDRVIRSVEGKFKTGAEFIRHANQVPGASPISSSTFFCGDGELVCPENRTYALAYSIWTMTLFRDTMANLCEKFADRDISFRPSK